MSVALAQLANRLTRLANLAAMLDLDDESLVTVIESLRTMVDALETVDTSSPVFARTVSDILGPQSHPLILRMQTGPGEGP